MLETSSLVKLGVSPLLIAPFIYLEQGDIVLLVVF
jgi:hypothetical protein